MILIFGMNDDVHAEAVASAVTKLGSECRVFRYEDFPRLALASVTLPEGEIELVTDPQLDPILFSQVKAVWNRRAVQPTPPDYLRLEDRDLAIRSSRRFLDAVRLASRPWQTWVNDRRAQLQASSKLYQLELAHQLGLKVPDTLVSNCPSRVRDFVSRGSTIAKALIPMQWGGGAGSRTMATRPITLSQLASDRAISACPLIYQHMVEKAFELRIVAFGEDVVACRIDSQKQAETSIDYRVGEYEALSIEPYHISDGLREKIVAFMRAAGLLHASFDFAVDRHGNPTFFEVNEQGQSLWIEDRNPEIRILDRICAFLLDPRPDFRWDGVHKVAFSAPT